MPTTPLVDANKQLVLDLLGQVSFQDKIMDALYDYLTLLDIDYDKLFQCQCNLSEEDKTYVTGIYDNACKWWVFHVWCDMCCDSVTLSIVPDWRTEGYWFSWISVFLSTHYLFSQA